MEEEVKKEEGEGDQEVKSGEVSKEGVAQSAGEIDPDLDKLLDGMSLSK